MGEALAEFSSRHWTQPSTEPEVDPKDLLPYPVKPPAFSVNPLTFPKDAPAFLNNPPVFLTNPMYPTAYKKDLSPMHPHPLAFPPASAAHLNDPSICPKGEEVTRPMLGGGGGFVLATSSKPQENQDVEKCTELCKNLI